MSVYIFFIIANLAFIFKLLGINTTWPIIALIVLSFFMMNHKKVYYKQLMLLPVLLILFPFNDYGVSVLITYLIAAYSMADKNLSTILKANILSIAVLFILMAILQKTGILQDVEFKKIFVAHTFGFENANTPGIFFSWLMLSTFILFYNRNKWIIYISLLVSLVLFYYTSSRGILLVSGLILLSLIIPSKWFDSLTIRRLVVITLLIFIPCYFIYIITRSIHEVSILNDLSSSRILFMKKLLLLFNPTTLITGQRLDADIIVDNSFMIVLLYGGCLSLMWVLWRFYTVMSDKNCSYPVFIVLTTIFVWSFIEACFVNPFISGTYLLWILLIRNPISTYKKEIYYNV